MSGRKLLQGALLAMLCIVALVYVVQDIGDRTFASPLEEEPLDCSAPTPVGGWAPWAFDDDGFKTYSMTVGEAQTEYGFELPSMSPAGFARVEDMAEVVYISGSDFTVHVLWQQPSAAATGETIALYVKYGSPYEDHFPGSVWWTSPSGVEYELASIDPSVTPGDLMAMACSMPSYTGACP